MKLRGLALPADLAPIVARVSRRPGPPDEVRDRLRRQLDWAFLDAADTKVVYAPGRRPLHTVATVEGRAFRLDRWATTAARAAAALVLAHVPLALAGLGVALAAVPVTQLLLSHIGRETASPHPTMQVGPTVAHRPVPAPRSPAPSILVVPSLAPLPAPFEPPEPAPVPSAAQPVTSLSLVPAPAEPSGDDLSLSVERELLDQARRALVRGDPIGALASLNQHGVRYPDSQLAEEREALTIQALLRAGRVGDARFRGEAFRRRFPSSLLLPALDAALHE